MKATRDKIKQLRYEANKLEKELLSPKNKIIKDLSKKVNKVSEGLDLEWQPKSTPKAEKMAFTAYWEEEDKITLSHHHMEYELDRLLDEYRWELNAEFDKWVAKCPKLKQRNKEIKEVCDQIDETAKGLGISSIKLMGELGIT